MKRAAHLHRKERSNTRNMWFQIRQICTYNSTQFVPSNWSNLYLQFSTICTMVWSHLRPQSLDISYVFRHFHTRWHQICTCKYINFVHAYPPNLYLQLRQICTCTSALFVPAYPLKLYLHMHPICACNCVQFARAYTTNLHLQVHQIWTCIIRPGQMLVHFLATKICAGPPSLRLMRFE